MKKINNEVFVADETIVRVQRKDIAALKESLPASSRKRVRLCAHHTMQDRLHEMLIVLGKNTYIRPHRHRVKSESFHIIEGLLDVVVFTEEGGVAEVIPMGDYSSGRNFFYRIVQPLFHTVLIRSDMAVFHETTNGPFERSDTEFAPWAPEEADTEAAGKYVRSLLEL